MTVNNDIDDDSATKHSDFHTTLHSMWVHVVCVVCVAQVCVVHRSHFSVFGSIVITHFAEDRFISGNQHDQRHPLNRSLRMRLVRQSATMQLVSIHLTMSG